MRRRWWQRVWIAAKVGRHVFWLFPFTLETGHDHDEWTGYGLLVGTREPPTTGG